MVSVIEDVVPVVGVTALAQWRSDLNLPRLDRTISWAWKRFPRSVSARIDETNPVVIPSMMVARIASATRSSTSVMPSCERIQGATGAASRRAVTALGLRVEPATGFGYRH